MRKVDKKLVHIPLEQLQIVVPGIVRAGHDEVDAIIGGVLPEVVRYLVHKIHEVVRGVARRQLFKIHG